MWSRKEKYDPTDPRDAGELLNYLYTLPSDDELADEIENFRELDFVLLPPRDGNDTDQDDASSDLEGNETVRDIGKGVLSQPMVVVGRTSEKVVDILHVNSSDQSQENETDWSDADNEPLAKKVKAANDKNNTKKNDKKAVKQKRVWRKRELERRDCRLDDLKNCQPTIIQEIQNEKLCPSDIFKKNFDDDFMQYICQETEKYAIFKGVHDFKMTVEELYKYFAILLLSGYSKVPFRRMYWETRRDTYNPLVANSMSRNRFEAIHRFLHFNDNTKTDDEDKIYKVRPLVNHLNEKFSSFVQPLGKWFSLDEAMEPYYGHHRMKQFIRGKPIRYGFKFWCLTTHDGYLIKFIPYTGGEDKIEGMSLGSSVSKKLYLNFIPIEGTVFLDNYFNSLPLLNQLTANNINCVGTIRQDRIEKAPIPDLKKEKRGTYYILQDTNSCITLTRWHDNSQVTMATNLDSRSICLTKGTCRRWSKKEKSMILVEQPTVVALYNKGMGGVDLFDNLRGLYRIKIRSKKWYWPLVRFCLNGAVVNMWRLYRQVDNIGLLEFTRRIVLAILTTPEPLGNKAPRPKSSNLVLNEIRYDGRDHLVDKQDTQRRCGKCGKSTKFSCIKYNVGLHPDGCFRQYHIMDPLYNAVSQFRRRHYDKCIQICTSILDKQPLDQAAWCLKMRALTQRVYVDDLETEDLMDVDVMDENAVATAPRPGTSIKTSNYANTVQTSGMTARPRTATGRPISGVIRPGTQSRPESSFDRLKTARPITGQSARAIRLGTAAMLSTKDGPFIQVSRLNLSKYAKNTNLAKPLFEYLYYHEGDVRNAMELAVQATQQCEFKDWWWKVQLAKCYVSLNLVRDAEQQLRSALKQYNHVEVFIRLARIYVRLDQPLSAQDICKAGLEIFPNDVTILTELARLNEVLAEMQSSIKYYRSVVVEDAMNVEAIASIGVYHFYNNQPELALRYYRRVLAMGAHSAELYNNLGLCCLYSQQLDLTLVCFQRALDLATDPLIKADIWYNLAHVAIAAGDLHLAMECLNLCLSSDPNHAAALNNLAIMYHKLGRLNLAKAYLVSAKNTDPDLSEAQVNLEYLENK